MSSSRTLLVAATFAIFALSASACGPVTIVPDPPTQGSYNLVFPNSSAAVVTEGVKIFVYDSAAPDINCDRLLAARRTGQTLPPALLESNTFGICDLLNNAQSTRMNVGYGKRTFLAVGFNKGADLLIGCNAGEVSPDATPVAISLGTVNITRPLPPAKCAQLADVCSTPPRCQ